MKKQYLAICILTLSCFASCDVMDTTPFESYPEDLVWGSEATADAFAVQSYNQAINHIVGSAEWESRTPNGIRASQVGEGIDNIATELGVDVYTDMGFNRFTNLRACNQLIEKASESSILSVQKKKELIAEGHFLRGLIFFDQARKIGRFVPTLKVVQKNDKEELNRDLTKTVDESYQIVMADLTKAAYEMTDKTIAGRGNKYVAHLIRSRAALQAYAYTKNASYLDSCIVSAQFVISSGKYALNPDYKSMFNAKPTNDSEILLSRSYLSEDFTVGSVAELVRAYPNVGMDDITVSAALPIFNNQSVRTFESWSIFFPTQDLVDQYLVVDEVDGQAKTWFETSQFVNNVDNIEVGGIKNAGQIDQYSRTNGEVRRIPSPQDLNTGRTDFPLFSRAYVVKPGSARDISKLMYQNRDKRFYASIVYDNSTWMNETVTLNLAGNLSQGVRSKEDGGWYNTVSGYYWRKSAYEPAPKASPNIRTDFHYVVARLGEAYLNLSEAYLLKGVLNKAREALNMTRVTHGGLPPSSATTATDLWKDYIRERRVEMAYENGDIYFSYLRWGKYGGDANYGKGPNDVIHDLNRPVYKVQISRDRTKVLCGQITLLNSWNRNFTNRRYLFPIPQGQIDIRAAHGITDDQNSGW